MNHIFYILFFCMYSTFHSGFYWWQNESRRQWAAPYRLFEIRKNKFIHSFISENHPKNDQFNMSRGSRRENIARKIWIISNIKYEYKCCVIRSVNYELLLEVNNLKFKTKRQCSIQNNNLNPDRNSTFNWLDGNSIIQMRLCTNNSEWLNSHHSIIHRCDYNYNCLLIVICDPLATILKSSSISLNSVRCLVFAGFIISTRQRFEQILRRRFNCHLLNWFHIGPYDLPTIWNRSVHFGNTKILFQIFLFYYYFFFYF